MVEQLLAGSLGVPERFVGGPSIDGPFSHELFPSLLEILQRPVHRGLPLPVSEHEDAVHRGSLEVLGPRYLVEEALAIDRIFASRGLNAGESFLQSARWLHCYYKTRKKSARYISS